MGAVEKARALIEPVVISHNMSLYDLELAGGILKVTVERTQGVDVDVLGEISQKVSRLLDENDPIPDSRYLLEVSTPGVERRLRTPEHFSAQIGSEARFKLKVVVDGSKRYEGRIVSVSDESVEIDCGDGIRHLQLADIENARTVYDWSQDGPPDSPEKKAAAR